MHSNPTFYPTIYRTFIDVYFTWRFILRRSIECVFRSPGRIALACRLWAQGSHWRGHLYTGQTDVLPQTEHDVDLWFSWEHCDPSSWIGLGWWENTEYAAGFSAVLTGERSKCRPITSLSLFQRKLSVKFISLPRKCRDTCRNVLTQKKVWVKKHFPTEQAFLQDINQFKEKMKISSGSLIWKNVRD